jgi:hypothetical protein
MRGQHYGVSAGALTAERSDVDAFFIACAGRAGDSIARFTIAKYG